ncbi:hypothetical protein LXL04_005484 [Taraxacum kok-saghyz]
MMERFLDLNSSPNHRFEYFEESLKQTMLDHDIIFKKQARFLINNLFSQEEDEDDDDDDDLNGVELNLSLTIGSTNKRRKSWKNKIVFPSSIEIIDLEESSGIESSDNGVDLHKDPLQVDSICSKRDSLMNGAMHHEWSSSNQGSNELHDAKQTKVMDFDLNEDQPDESFHSNEPSSDLTEEKEIIIPNVIEENAIQKAANSLVLISLQQISTTNHDSESKSGSNDTKIKNPNPRRSSSIDSYESLVLKLEETSVDEDCVTSKAFDVTKLGETEIGNRNGIKLKRGRRLKDFQKDILPTLSSLSRHEIWEDIKILEGVIRSREYKRLQKEKRGNGENWFTPVKSKRSKVNYVGQKRRK